MASAIFHSVICAQCGKREAVVFIRRRGGGSDGCDLVLCEDCAKGRGIMAGKGVIDLNIDDLIGASLEARPQGAASEACSRCGLSFDGFKREGRLGCALCADAFALDLGRMLGRKSAPDAQYLQRARQSPLASLERDLEAAIASEDYEKAAAIRDSMAKSPGSPEDDGPYAAADFPLGPSSFSYSGGPDDDCVLWSSAYTYRNLESLPFPGSPGGSSAPSRDLLLERFAALPPWSATRMAELNPAERRSLSERGVLPRGYAADDGAVLVAKASRACYALLDDIDHLRIRAVRPGLNPESALQAAIGEAAAIDSIASEGKGAFSQRPGLGWVCARALDCGLGSSVSALLHLPALAAAGMRDRLFRSLMADGIVVKGYYSTSEESSGSLYELAVEPRLYASLEGMVAALRSSAFKAVSAERRARAELATRGIEALRDAEGRAFGIARHCGLLGAEEGASIVSILRLAALRGSLPGASPRALGTLLMELGSGSVSASAGLRELAPAEAAEAARARLVKVAIAKAEYRSEEGSPCSRV